MEKIGEPQDIILSYYEKLGNQYVISQMKITQFIRNFIIAFCVIVTVLHVIIHILNIKNICILMKIIILKNNNRRD